jgi:hypothetical protein
MVWDCTAFPLPMPLVLVLVLWGADVTDGANGVDPVDLAMDASFSSSGFTNAAEAVALALAVSLVALAPALAKAGLGLFIAVVLVPLPVSALPGEVSLEI